MSILDFLFWLLLALLLLYAILKAVGYIHSPEWLEASPYILIALITVLIKLTVRDEVSKATNSLNKTMKSLKDETEKIKGMLYKHEGILETILHLKKRK